MPDPPHPPLAALLIFLLGCAPILAGRGHARAVTALPAGAAAVPVLIGVELALDRLGVPSGDVEAGRLFRPTGEDRDGISPARGTASSSPSRS